MECSHQIAPLESLFNINSCIAIPISVELIKNQFDYIDTSDDGFLTLDEVLAVPVSENHSFLSSYMQENSVPEFFLVLPEIVSFFVVIWLNLS